MIVQLLNLFAFINLALSGPFYGPKSSCLYGYIMQNAERIFKRSVVGINSVYSHAKDPNVKTKMNTADEQKSVPN